MAFVPRLHIHCLGPIKECDISMNKMIVLDGPQAAGKSTIAKAIFFFRTVKDEMYKSLFSDWADPVPELNIRYNLNKKFSQMFSSYVSKDTYLSYEYTPHTKVEFSMRLNRCAPIQLSDNILSWLEKRRPEEYHRNNIDTNHIRKELGDLFDDYHEIVYIPAGRSMLSILTYPLEYILAMLSDKEKNMIDYCVLDYIKRVIRVKPFFAPKLLGDGTDDSELSKVMQVQNPKLFIEKHVKEQLKNILKGEYRYVNGEEQLKLLMPETQRTLRINSASSGQQEALWILNLLYYYIHECQSSVFIIEEPEAHLYPDSQKEIAEYIALSLFEENQCIITTHSPYILGALNNLLDGGRLRNSGVDISSVLKKNGLLEEQLLYREEFSAYFIENGVVSNAMDEETGLIQNEMIDGASDAINHFADELFDLESVSNE